MPSPIQQVIPMRTLWETTATLGVALLLTACGTDPNATTPAPAPTPAPVSVPVAVTPTPVPAAVPAPVPVPPPAPTSYKVKLAWTAPSTRANGTALTLSELSGYRLYYLREGSSAADDTTITIQGGTTTSYNLTVAQAGDYTFAITAVDQNGLESPLSGTISVPVK